MTRISGTQSSGQLRLRPIENVGKLGSLIEKLGSENENEKLGRLQLLTQAHRYRRLASFPLRR